MLVFVARPPAGTGKHRTSATLGIIALDPDVSPRNVQGSAGAAACCAFVMLLAAQGGNPGPPLDLGGMPKLCLPTHASARDLNQLAARLVDEATPVDRR